jgi:hypothetical protein
MHPRHDAFGQEWGIIGAGVADMYLFQQVQDRSKNAQIYTFSTILASLTRFIGFERLLVIYQNISTFV